LSSESDAVVDPEAAERRSEPEDLEGRRHLEELLDEALEESFPASDAPAVDVA
jgi:hypothetical protein